MKTAYLLCLNRMTLCLSNKRWGILLLTLLILTVSGPESLFAAPKVVDYQRHVSKKFKKQVRSSTRFIVVHSTESGLKSALVSLSRRGHANYLVDASGTIFRIVEKVYRADHAGISVWDGQTDISDHSIGIELVGYHNAPFTDEQYASLAWLLDTLQKQYDVPDWLVLEHFRVAYGEPHRYVKQRHRGRKKDPGIFNFDRSKAGLLDSDARNSMLYDPDVAAGRLIADPDIDIARIKTKDTQKYEEAVEIVSSNVITLTNTAWRIAREEYDTPTTAYEFPDGTVLRGNEITDWSHLPQGTIVHQNRPLEEGAGSKNKKTAAKWKIPIITEGMTAIDIAGRAYKRSDTYYLFPNGTIRDGRKMRQWSSIPSGVRVLVGYHAPVQMTKSSRKSASVRDAAKQSRTVFVSSSGKVLSGAPVKDPARLKVGSLMFVKKK